MPANRKHTGGAKPKSTSMVEREPFSKGSNAVPQVDIQETPPPAAPVSPPAEERPSLMERMIHLANLRGELLGVTEHAAKTGIPGDLDRCLTKATAYILALEDEVERHGIIVKPR